MVTGEKNASSSIFFKIHNVPPVYYKWGFQGTSLKVDDAISLPITLCIIHWPASDPLLAEMNNIYHLATFCWGTLTIMRKPLDTNQTPLQTEHLPPRAPAHPMTLVLLQNIMLNPNKLWLFFFPKQISGNSWTDPWPMLSLCILHQWHVLSFMSSAHASCVFFMERNWSERQFVHLLLCLFGPEIMTAPEICTTDGAEEK